MQANTTHYEFTKGMLVTIDGRFDAEVIRVRDDGKIVVEAEPENGRHETWIVSRSRVSLSDANEFDNYMAVRETEE